MQKDVTQIFSSTDAITLTSSSQLFALKATFINFLRLK